MRGPEFPLEFYRRGRRGCALSAVPGPRIERELGAWPCPRPRDLGVVSRLRHGMHQGQLTWGRNLLLGLEPAFLPSFKSRSRSFLRPFVQL